MAAVSDRWSLIAVVALVAATFVLAASPASAAEDDRTVTFDGAGWGHAVGMSQYGAQARALDGQEPQTADQILTAYYTGSAIGTLGADGVPAVGDVHVNVASDRIVMTVSVVAGPGEPSDGVLVGRGSGVSLEQKTLNPGDSFTITDTSDNVGGCTVAFSDESTWTEGSCDVGVELADGAADPPHLLSLDSCRTNSCTFGWGTSLLFADNWATPANMRSANDQCPSPLGPVCDGFDVVVQVPIDDYARGVAEVPFSWHREALHTQAIAARSYMASFAAEAPHTSRGCFCDLRNSSSDQVYAGWLGARASWQLWDAAALATAGQVVTHPEAVPGTIVRSYYSSSNGGASESSEDKWGGDRPYLVSVPDPWSLEPANPFASWTETTTQAEFAAWLGMTDVRDVEVTEANTSGSPRTFFFGGFDADGNVVSATKQVGEIQQRFGLKSWFFSIDIDQPPPPPPPKPDQGADRVALHDPRSGVWHLAESDGAVSSFYYGNPRDIPYSGDWDGDGVVTLGLYRQSTGFLFLRNSNTQGIADIEIFYGDPGDIPIAGDWDGDGIDTVGIFRPSDARFYLRNTNTQGIADLDFQFGDGGDFPVAGDWDGDGIDTVGVYRPSTRTLYLTNSRETPTADITFSYTGAAAGDRIVAGDWDDDGIDTIGLYRPSDGTFYLRDTFTQSSANIVIEMGDSWMNPVAGWWGD